VGNKFINLLGTKQVWWY